MIYHNLLKNQLDSAQQDVKLLFLNLEREIKNQDSVSFDDKKAYEAVSSALVQLNYAALYIRAK